MALQDRMIRAIRGEAALFEEVENDQAATTEALIIVGLGAVSVGVGSALLLTLIGLPGAGVTALIRGVIGTLVGWAVFSGVAYFVGTRLFHATATWEEVLRTLGYAYTPMVIGIAGAIPGVGSLVVLAASLWSLYLAFIAIRSALDVDTGKAVATILISIVPSWIILALVSAPLGGSSLYRMF